VHLQTLGSGSRGNATLVRAGELNVLIDAGLGLRELERRLEAVGVPPRSIGHLFVTHGHLDHARSAGALSKRHGTTLHCCERLMRNASIQRARRMSALRVGHPNVAPGPRGEEELSVTPVLIPHDAEPTVAFQIDHQGRQGHVRAIVLTDMGHPDLRAARALTGAQVLVLEFNHDRAMLESGPYPRALKRRVGGDRGHLSNEQAAEMLSVMAGPELHTLVLAHLSEKNNRPELAEAAARNALEELGLPDVRVLVAGQDEVGPSLTV